MKKEISTLVNAAEKAGWKVRKNSRGGHIMFYPPDKSKEVITVSSSPSDYRAIVNIRRDLKKAGLKI